MAWQLVYTSAPRLLDAGRSGFGTVARHRQIPALLVQAVERISQFARLPGMDPNRIVHSHRIIAVSGTAYHVLSMIRSAGSDYTGRTNHIAHHLILTDREAAQCLAANLTPADVLIAFRWLGAWDGQPRMFDESEQAQLPAIPQVTLNHSAWGEITGNPEHVLLLVTNPASNGCRLIGVEGADFRFVFLESLRWRMATSWQVTFTTAEDPNDDPGDFRWIVASAGSRTASATDSSRPILDLTQPERLPIPERPVETISAPPALASPPPPTLRKPGQPYQEPSSGSRHGVSSAFKEPLKLSPPPPPPTIFSPQSVRPPPYQPAPTTRQSVPVPVSGSSQNQLAAMALVLGVALVGYAAVMVFTKGRSSTKPAVTEEQSSAPPKAKPAPLPPEPKIDDHDGKKDQHKDEIAITKNADPQVATSPSTPPPSQSDASKPMVPTPPPPAAGLGANGGGSEPTPTKEPGSKLNGKAPSEISPPTPPKPFKLHFITDINNLSIPVRPSEVSVGIITTPTAKTPGGHEDPWLFEQPTSDNFFWKKNSDGKSLFLIRDPISGETSGPKLEANKVTDPKRAKNPSDVRQLWITAKDKHDAILDKIYVLPKDAKDAKGQTSDDNPLLPEEYEMTLKDGFIKGELWDRMDLTALAAFKPTFIIKIPKEIQDQLAQFIPVESGLIILGKDNHIDPSWANSLKVAKILKNGKLKSKNDDLATEQTKLEKLKASPFFGGQMYDGNKYKSTLYMRYTPNPDDIIKTVICNIVITTPK